MTLKEKYAEVPAVGCLSFCNWGGLEILDILYGIDDYAVACFNYGDGRKNIRKHKIMYTTSGRSYIRKYGVRYYFDDIIKVN